MKVLKWILILIGILAIGAYFGYQYMISETKKHSPQETVSYEANDFKMSVTYSRPYKKGRKIFGDLVPFQEVWRTGANEPTTFTINQDITMVDGFVKAGTYSIWVIPYSSQWTVILNSEVPSWGVGFDSKASRNPDYDVYKVNIPISDLNEPLEQFTIDFEYHVNMTMAWDQTKITIPIMYGY